ncbi:hypothetical protein OG711_21775 [Streptomyces uncialis]|uniref:hypothetical protein n=1 Tax=Streptomyces uncialis TaxID=1048205 RepID=UPI002E337056|nr:hypothetical protein [Streptomyces uncialis]
MDFSPVGPSYWVDDERVAAEEVATDFVNALRRVEVDFDGISIDRPCDRCHLDDYRIALGLITLDEARRMTATVNAVLDRLNL